MVLLATREETEMKRFARWSRLRDQLHRLFVTAMLALAALALLGKAAHAQTSCGDITNQPHAECEDRVDAALRSGCLVPPPL